MNEKRYFGLDAVRIMALCLLLWLHFLLRNGFYSKPVNSLPMILAAGGRCMFMCCIPLFLMLTGYLKCGKEWNRRYYHSLLPILIAWVIVSGLCLVYKIQVNHTVKTPYQWLVEFFEFDLANYSWYIEMYIGLLLVSPFLNIAWNAIDDRKRRMWMVATFVVLTLVPKTFDGFKFDGETAINPIPNYWNPLWYFTYYMIGCYIRTYQPKVRSWIAIPLAVVIAVLFGVINSLTGGAQSRFYNGYNISYNHLGTAAIAILLFLGVYRADCRSERICRAARFVSGITLEMYLVSCLFDQKIYAWKKGKYGAEEFLWRGLLATGLVFCLSLVTAWVIHWIAVRASGMIMSRIPARIPGIIATEKNQ